jgi:hypothetical protein
MVLGALHLRGSPSDRGYPLGDESGGILDPPVGMEAGGGGRERWRRRGMVVAYPPPYPTGAIHSRTLASSSIKV